MVSQKVLTTDIWDKDRDVLTTQYWDGLTTNLWFFSSFYYFFTKFIAFILLLNNISMGKFYAGLTDGTKYSRMAQVKFMEDNL